MIFDAYASNVYGKTWQNWSIIVSQSKECHLEAICIILNFSWAMKKKGKRIEKNSQLKNRQEEEER